MADHALAALFSALQILILFALAYHYLLLVAGALRPLGRRRMAPKTVEDPAAIPGHRGGPRFAILIPAHNEAPALPATLETLHEQAYPEDRYDTYVIADHCTDTTADVAKRHRAHPLIREAPPAGRKAYALRWGLDQLVGKAPAYDAYVIFDADSLVDPGFLGAMAGVLSEEHPVLQGQHLILHPERRRFSGLATVDMRLNNLLHNQAKTNLGLSCRLMGDGMCFSATVILRFGWPADSLGEDREFGIRLASEGVRCTYVPDAISYGQAAPSWRSASRQRLRWYGGVAETQRKLIPIVLHAVFRKRDLVALDQLIELLMPPLSALGVLSVGVWLVQRLWPGLAWILPSSVWTAVVLLWLSLPPLGLLVARAPIEDLRALLLVPVYVPWRIWVGLRARLLGNRVPWVRTLRQEEVPQPKETE